MNPMTPMPTKSVEWTVVQHPNGGIHIVQAHVTFEDGDEQVLSFVPDHEGMLKSVQERNKRTA